MVMLDTINLPLILQSRKFKPEAKQRLEEAIKRGSISTHEIALIIPPTIVSDRKSLSEVITWFNTQIIVPQNVRLISDKEAVEHNERYPWIAHSRHYFQSNQNQEVLEQKLKELGLLTAEQERELGRKMLEQHDTESRDTLIVRNIRLVKWVAKKYSWSGIDILDLEQEGMLGLIKAAEKYDYRLGRFSTYAVNWIRQAISRMIQNDIRPVRIPVNTLLLRQKLMRISSEIITKTGKSPSLEEIAEKSGVPVEKIRKIILVTQRVSVPLDSHVDSYNERSTSFGDSIPDGRLLSPGMRLDAEIELKIIKDRIASIIDQVTMGIDISQRDIKMFKTFYGLDDRSKKHNLRSTGEKFGITRERVRQIIKAIWEEMQGKEYIESGELFRKEVNRMEIIESTLGLS